MVRPEKFIRWTKCSKHPVCPKPDKHTGRCKTKHDREYYNILRQGTTAQPVEVRNVDNGCRFAWLAKFNHTQTSNLTLLWNVGNRHSVPCSDANCPKYTAGTHNIAHTNLHPINVRFPFAPDEVFCVPTYVLQCMAQHCRQEASKPRWKRRVAKIYIATSRTSTAADALCARKQPQDTCLLRQSG